MYKLLKNSRTHTSLGVGIYLVPYYIRVSLALESSRRRITIIFTVPYPFVS